MHIVRFCVRGAERARTTVVAAAQAAWMAGSGWRRAWVRRCRTCSY